MTFPGMLFKAAKSFNEAAARTCRLRFCSLSHTLGGRPVSEPEPADLLVNCTTIGLQNGGALKQLPLRTDEFARYACVVDLVYAPTETPLVNAARRAGASVVDGLELLVAQGALSFELFTGRPAPRDVMRAAVREP